jgi:hypothetical protein
MTTHGESLVCNRDLDTKSPYYERERERDVSVYMLVINEFISEWKGLDWVWF